MSFESVKRMVRERRRGATAVGLVAFLSATTAVLAADRPPAVGEAAADFSLQGLDDQTVSLKDANAAGPVVLVVLRGFPGYQCPVCSDQVAGLMAKAKQLGASKARVLLVYPGPADGLKKHAEEFAGTKKALPEPFTMLLDPDYTFTKAYGLRWNAPDETAYPSTFVIDAEGKVRFAKVSKSHGGRAEAGEVLAALAKLAD